MHSYEEFLKVIAVLRSEDGCPWDREQTHESLEQCMLEEAYEAVDGIRTYAATGDDTNLKEELGDVLLQVVMHAQIASEDGRFSMEDVVDGICEKMIRRHPHVFGKDRVASSEAALAQWDEIKKQEKKETSLADTLRRVANAYPANIRAEKVQKKAAKAGFEFDSTAQVLTKVKEELAELEEAMEAEQGHLEPENRRIEEEFGDLMFSLVNLSRFLGINAENSLTNATNKFINRCVSVETAAGRQGKPLHEMTAGELDVLWQSIK